MRWVLRWVLRVIVESKRIREEAERRGTEDVDEAESNEMPMMRVTIRRRRGEVEVEGRRCSRPVVTGHRPIVHPSRRRGLAGDRVRVLSPERSERDAVVVMVSRRRRRRRDGRGMEKSGVGMEVRTGMDENVRLRGEVWVMMTGLRLGKVRRRPRFDEPDLGRVDGHVRRTDPFPFCLAVMTSGVLGGDGRRVVERLVPSHLIRPRPGLLGHQSRPSRRSRRRGSVDVSRRPVLLRRMRVQTPDPRPSQERRGRGGHAGPDSGPFADVGFGLRGEAGERWTADSAGCRDGSLDPFSTDRRRRP